MATIKSAALYALACTVFVGVALSILAVVAGSWGVLQDRIILTSFTISGASLYAFICAALQQRDESHPLPIPGMFLSFAGAALVILAIWSDIGDETYGQVTISVILFATATAHVCGLSLARLRPGFRWALVVAYAAIYGLASTLTALLWAGHVGNQTLQLVAVLAIVAAGVTVLIPILHVISRSDDLAVPSIPTTAAVALTCPCCSVVVTHPLGTITCRQCGGVFVVRVIRTGHTSLA